MEHRWRSQGELVKRLPLWTTGDRALDLYLPAHIDHNKPPMTVVCLAGGGYSRRAWHEGPAVVLWLAMNGFAAVDVPYTTAEDIPAGEPLGLRPLRDACRAVRVVRDHAGQFGLSPNRVGVMGFSAGGHLAGSVALLHEQSNPGDDLAGTWSGRPDAAVMIYPVVSMIPPCHEGSANNLLGASASREVRERWSLQTRVTPAAPPLFVLHAQDDGTVPVQGSMELATAWQREGVPFEAHFFPTGGHGFGLALDNPRLCAWPGLLKKWLLSL
ncbi:MAG: alpha/beta hydrolase [Phycisphaeraceae bacterium]|nr:MAG: alpha/beta hydrolase [Phycisphaeraceae bacterium]